MRRLQSRLLKTEPPVSPMGPLPAARGPAAALGPAERAAQREQQHQQPAVPTDAAAEGFVACSTPGGKAGSAVSSMQVSPGSATPQHQRDGRQQQRADPASSPLRDTGCSSMQASPAALP